MSRYKLIITVVITLLLSLVVGVVIGKSADNFIYGVVVGDDKTFAENVKKFPGVTHAWSYSGFYKINSDVEMIPLYGVSTFIHPVLPYCPETMLVFNSPNMPWPYGHPIVERDPETNRMSINSPVKAVEMLHDVESLCPDTRLIVGQISPHSWCGWIGGYCGTGAEWLDEFLTAYGQPFSHTLGVILSENDTDDEYPISKQALDYLLVQQKHSVTSVWVTYFNSKNGNYPEWRRSLEMVRNNFDAIFVASPRAHPWLVSEGMDLCYRALLCCNRYTAAGKAYFRLLSYKEKR